MIFLITEKKTDILFLPELKQTHTERSTCAIINIKNREENEYEEKEYVNVFFDSGLYIVFCITGTGKNNRGFQGNEQKDVFGGI